MAVTYPSTTTTLKQGRLDISHPPAFKFIDLFAGIGGFRLAFESVGGKCVFSSEWDSFAAQTYFANYQEFPRGDITNISSSEIPDFDILLAGFPCQPFSSIGLRQGFEHRTQGTLFYEIVRIIREKRPSSFLLENVEGLVNHNGGETLSIILETLESQGYQVDFEVLNSSDFAVPQNRRRIYIVGYKNDIVGKNFKFSFPSKIRNDVYIGKFVEQNMEGYEISKHLQEVYIYKKEDGRSEIIDSNSQIHVKTLVATYHKIQRLTGTFVRDGSTGLRLLSEAECKAIMGFPSNFIIPVSRTQMYRQFGNSVAIPVVVAIAKLMKQGVLHG